MQIVLTVVGAYIGVCALLWAFQEKLLFHPRPVYLVPPNPPAEPVEIDRGAAVLRGWVINPDADGPLVVYFGGNAEELSLNIDNWSQREATTVLVNYRGFGDSTGKASERALRGDAVAVAEWARARYGDKPLVLFGLSLGSGIAVLTAAQVDASAIILVSPYRSIEHVARRTVPLVPVGTLLRHRFAAESAVGDLPRALVIASARDRVIPFRENLAMVDAIRRGSAHPLELRQIDVAHNEFMTDARVWRVVDGFLAQLVSEEKDHG